MDAVEDVVTEAAVEAAVAVTMHLAVEEVAAVVAAATTMEAEVEAAAATAEAVEEAATNRAVDVAEVHRIRVTLALALVVAEAVAEAVVEAVVALRIPHSARRLGEFTTGLQPQLITLTHNRAEGQNPVPDAAIHDLENKTIKQQSMELDKRVKSSGKATRTAFSEYLPARPAFGDQGQKTVVWANYFGVGAKPVTVHKYGLRVSKVVSAEDKKAKGFKEADIRGRKLQLVVSKLLPLLHDEPERIRRQLQDEVNRIQEALKKGGGDAQATEAELGEAKGKLEAFKKDLPTYKKQNKVIVSEFKSQILSLQELFLGTNIFRVTLSEEAITDGGEPRVDYFDVELLQPIQIPLADILSYLTSNTVPADDIVFPRYPDAVDALNMILGYRPRSDLDGVSVVGGSKFYAFTANPQIASLGQDYRPLIAARGFFQSARLGTGRMLLNTQVTHGVFKLSGKATEIFQQLECYPCQGNGDRYALKAAKAISKCFGKVRASVTFRTASGREVKRVKAVEGLVFASEMGRKRNKGANPDKFQAGWEVCGPGHVSFWNTDDGKYVTVKQHFENKYKLKLGDYPLFNFGRGDKNSYFPAEVVEIMPGQQAKVKLTGKETTAMLDFACRSPYSNAKSLVDESRGRLGHDDPLLQQFGVTVAKNLLAVHARVFNPPTVSYHNRATITPAFGSWNLKNVKVLRPGQRIERWACMHIKFSHRSQDVGRAQLEPMIIAWQNMGIAMGGAPIIIGAMNKQDAGQGRLDAFFKDMKSKDVQLIIFVLSEKDSGGVYNHIKTLGDCVYGIHTSCVVEKPLMGASPMTFANLGLKVNLKAGGVNHKLSQDLDILKEGKTMFVGYDVTHPTNMELPKGGGAPPSLVGLVSSIDSELGQWPSVTWEQASRQEMLSTPLEGEFASRIDLWQRSNKNKRLENIVIYRDGVSEGQFTQVLTEELPMIRSACSKKFPDGLVPRLTVIVSVKRHQTRFYPTDGNNQTRSGNIRNGTVVDRGVTQVRYWDFYLTAHDALKGTARPAHYTVLLDEIFRPRYNQGAANALEKVTHELCYLFGRATKAVSICPPAYYADLVCERARAHRPEFAGSEDGSEIGHKPAQTREIHPALKNSMYYI